MHRRALLSVSALSLAGLAGCLGDVRRAASGTVRMDHASATLHPATEPWFVGGLSAESSDAYHAELFTEAPPDDADLFTDHYPRREYSLDNDVRNDDYSTGFLLLFEAKMPRAEPYTVGPTILHGDVEWTGWNGVSLPLERSPRDPDDLSFDGDPDELVCTMLARYESASSPSEATVRVYDGDGNQRGGRVVARPRFG